MNLTGTQVLHAINIILNLTPEPLNAFTLKRAAEQYQTYNIDWHEYGYLLDALDRIELIKVNDHNSDGLTQYKLNYAHILEATK